MASGGSQGTYAPGGNIPQGAAPGGGYPRPQMGQQSGQSPIQQGICHFSWKTKLLLFFLARSQYFQECKNISTMIFFPQVIPEEPVDAEIKIFLTSAYLLNAKHDVLTLTILITH